MNIDKMDLIWGIEQMERELSKNHSPASNIMNICTEVIKQVNKLIEKDAGRSHEKGFRDEM